MNHSIRIAIVGGGLAGASLIHALVKFPHLDVHIFESAAAFEEAGMAIGIARNAQAALELIGSSAAQCLERAGAVPMRGVRFMLAYGETAGSVADEVDDVVQGKRLTSIVHRADFLQELLADIPRDRMHTSKKLLKNSGAWFLTTLQPFDKAQSSLGKELVNIEDAREYGWAGKNAFLTHKILSGGRLVQFAIASHNEEVTAGPDHWHRAVGIDEIKKLYQDWSPYLNKAVNELLCGRPEHKASYLWDHPSASSYVSGPICITGDAAHSTTPWQGSGDGMSIEDSLILSSLHGRANVPSEAIMALQVYDQVRRPRTQRIVESSRVTGAMLTGREEIDQETLRKFMSRWDFIIDIDMERHRGEAIQLMEAKLKGEIAM
ncbi:hypothetical protein GGR58DRAFT_505253 [Xylaria digitata]|nr:hypothetical protein GGR58DRAFT_505253 [Xylaria digitata]